MRYEFDDNTNESKEPINTDEVLQELTKKINELSLKVEKLEQKIDNNATMINSNEITSKVQKKKNKFFWVGEVAFYALLVCIIFGAFLIKSNSDGRPTSFAGYSMFTVLTGSMESEIPKGSFVITKYVEPENLKIGDDITYMANETTTVTHRITAIVEKYQDTGKRAFETKGIMNTKPDKNLVPASNVVGKVVFHNKFLGSMANFIDKNWPFIIFVMAVVFIISSVIKKILNQDDKNDNKQAKVKKRRLKIRKFKRKEVENG